MPTYFDSLFTFAAAGLGLLLAGGLNLAFGRGGRRVWLRLVVTLVACGAVVAGLAAFTRQELAIRAAGVVFGVLFVATLFGSDWFTRKVSSLVTFVRKPAARWSLVAVGGLLLIFGSVFAFDRADEAAAEQVMQNLEMAVGRPPVQPATGPHVTTDRGNQIVLKQPIAARDPNELAGAELKTLQGMKFGDQVIRRSGPSDNSNCHGWVFTGGKFLLSPDDVEQIVKENGYTEVHEPQPGDLVLYRQGGTVAHSAIVRYVSEGQPVLVEGKWGGMGVFLHPADKSCYGTDYTFYRSGRASHLLVGLGGSPAPNAGMTAVTEE